MADSNVKQVSVVADHCYVYESESFGSPILNGEDKIEFKHGDKLNVLSDAGNNFIQVNFTNGENEQSGYVYRYYVTYSTLPQTQYPVFNGRVSKNDAVIYSLDKTDSGHVAKSGQGIYLYEGFKKDEWNNVAIVLEDGTLYYGYMKTTDITPNGINTGLITGITLIMTCLTLIFMLLFMKKKKKNDSKS